MPDTIRPDVAAFLAAMRESGVPPLNALPVAEARAMLLAMRSMSDADPTPLAIVRNMAVQGAGGAIPVRLYDRRQQRETGPLILFMHGGGFVVGDLDTHEPFCTYLADRTDIPVLAIDYRLAPEHPFPAAPEDAEAVARWACESPAALGFRVSGLITCGDSAGGNLAVITGKTLAARPAAVPLLAQWVLYPYIGSNSDWPSMLSFAEGYMLTEEAMRWFFSHYAAPVEDPRHDCMLGDIPMVPLLVHTAGLDPLRDQGLAYAEKARIAGAPVRYIEAKGMIHNFACMRSAIPSSHADIDGFIAAAIFSLDHADPL